MNTQEIRKYLDPERIEQVDVAVQVLKISRRAYIQQAVDMKLENLDHDRVLVSARDKAFKKRDNAEDAVKNARQQRDFFKAKMEEAVESLAVADAKLKAYQKRSWLAKLVCRKPRPNTTEGITLEAFVRFYSRLKNVGITPKQIDQILHPLYQSAGVPLTPEVDEKAVQRTAQ